ncbi:orexin receptor type 2-like [Glandiceps talaboti]
MMPVLTEITLCINTMSHHNSLITQVVTFTILFIVPFLILTAAYGRIASKLILRNLPGNGDVDRDQISMRNQKKVILMLMVAILAFFICWLPVQIFALVNTFYGPMQNPFNQDKVYPVKHFSIWLSMAHSFMNPIIYTFMNAKFRNDLRAICSGRGRLTNRRSKKSSWSTTVARRFSRMTAFTTQSTPAANAPLQNRPGECTNLKQEIEGDV